LGRATLGASNVIQFKADVKTAWKNPRRFFGLADPAGKGSFYSGNGRVA
jgi:hypothetical protein